MLSGWTWPQSPSRCCLQGQQQQAAPANGQGRRQQPRSGAQHECWLTATMTGTLISAAVMRLMRMTAGPTVTSKVRQAGPDILGGGQAVHATCGSHLNTLEVGLVVGHHARGCGRYGTLSRLLLVAVLMPRLPGV